MNADYCLYNSIYNEETGYCENNCQVENCLECNEDPKICTRVTECYELISQGTESRIRTCGDENCGCCLNGGVCKPGSCAGNLTTFLPSGQQALCGDIFMFCRAQNGIVTEKNS